MKKVSLCTFGLFPLLAILYLYLPIRPESTGNVPANKSSSTYTTLPTPAKPTPPPPQTLTPPLSTPARLTGQALTDKVNESMAKTARLFTPEFRRKLLDVKMKTRGPMYQKMFDSWDLDPSTAEDVLNVIRERETEYSDASQTLNETGMGNLKTWGESRRASKAWAETQLLLLLNEDQARQLAEAESSFDIAGAAKGMKIANDLANRPE